MILFGMGELGRKLIAKLKPRAVCDNNSKLWGQWIDGVEVLSPLEAIALYPDDDYIVTIYNGSAVRKQLADYGVKNVRHFLEFCPREEPDVEAVNRLMPLLADDESRRELESQAFGKFVTEHQPISEIYFPTFFERNPNEVFVDCGAFDGDSVRAFQKWSGAWSQIFALEPINPVRCDGTVIPCAVGDKNEFVRFSEAGTGSKSSEDGRLVQVVKLDDVFQGKPLVPGAEGDNYLVCDCKAWTEFESQSCHRCGKQIRGSIPTFIKMDIEGAEPMAIAGAARILREHKPRLAICLYHEPSHLWEIPLLIHSIQPDYKLYIRRYAEDCWETVCYAVAN